MMTILNAARSAGIFVQTCNRASFPVRSIERRISDLSREIINQDRVGDKMLPFELYKKEKCGSLEDYINEMKPLFPKITDEKFKELYEISCKSKYRSYKRACEGDNDPGLILTKDFFDESK